MSKITIENIVSYAQVANGLDIEKIAEQLPEFSYSPNEFLGLTLKLDDPKTAVLLLPSGKVICTGAKNLEDAKTSIFQLIDKIKNVKTETIKDIEVKVQNIVASTSFEKELHLSSISKGLLFDHVDYEPKYFPGLIYKMEDIGASVILFSSGKVVCTGTKSIEDASGAIETIKEKLLSLGAL